MNWEQKRYNEKLENIYRLLLREELRETRCFYEETCSGGGAVEKWRNMKENEGIMCKYEKIMKKYETNLKEYDVIIKKYKGNMKGSMTKSLYRGS